MIISVYFSFSNFNNIYRDTILESQLKMTGELVSGTIINMYEISTATNSDIDYNLTIPTKISSCIYSINVVNNKLILRCTNVASNSILFLTTVFAGTTMPPSKVVGVELSLYNFNIQSKNIIYSTNGLLKLSVRNGRVELSWWI